MNRLILIGGIFILVLIIIILIIIIVKLHRNQSQIKIEQPVPIITENKYIFIKTRSDKGIDKGIDKDIDKDIDKGVDVDKVKNNKIGNNLERAIQEKNKLAIKLKQLEQQLKTPAPSKPNQQSTPAPTP